jgi:hypothetical protein
MSDAEETARAICKALGRDPDAELVGGYEGPRLRQWEGYIREATAALEATPKPDSYPVCVEVRELEWRNTRAQDWEANVEVGQYAFGPANNGWMAMLRRIGGGQMDDVVFGYRFPTLEDAQAACQADFTRRTLELVNARSVESVRGEARTQGAAEERERASKFRRDVGHAVAQYRNMIRLHTTGEPILLRIVEERLSGNHDAADKLFDLLLSEEDQHHDQ